MSVKSTQGFNDFPVPIGSVIAYAGGIDAGRLPTNYLVCDGTSFTETEYPELFSVIGVTFGSVGVGQFNVPQMNGFVPQCANVAGVISPTPSASGISFDSLVLTAPEIPTITGITIQANISGGFPTGSSDSSQTDVSPNAIGGAYPMISWNQTSTVNMTSNSAPVFNYNNGTGTVAPVAFILTDANTIVVPNVEMVFLIKAKNQFFPTSN